MDSSKLKKTNLSQEDLFNFSELFKLMKPRVMSLVIFTCAVGLLTAPNLVSTKDAIIGILAFCGIQAKIIHILALRNFLKSPRKNPIIMRIHSHHSRVIHNKESELAFFL